MSWHDLLYLKQAGMLVVALAQAQGRGDMPPEMLFTSEELALLLATASMGPEKTARWFTAWGHEVTPRKRAGFESHRSKTKKDPGGTGVSIPRIEEIRQELIEIEANAKEMLDYLEPLINDLRAREELQRTYRRRRT